MSNHERATDEELSELRRLGAARAAIDEEIQLEQMRLSKAYKLGPMDQILVHSGRIVRMEPEAKVSATPAPAATVPATPEGDA